MSHILNWADLAAALPYSRALRLIDRAEIVDATHARGIKNVTMDELFFQGHFPQHPIMPGVLQVEALRQVCELLARPKLDPEGQGLDVYMREQIKIKFRQPVLPGDRILIEAEETAVEADRITYTARVSSRSGVTCEAKLKLAARPLSAPTTMPELWNEYDRNADSAMDVLGVMERIPHRFPFLLVDYVARIEGERVLAVKNLSGNEPYFVGAGDYAVMPEALLGEMLAQAGCVSVLSRPENKGKIGYFMAIEDGESFAPVFPGDQLVLDATLPATRSRFGRGSGKIYVGDRLISDFSMMFAIVDP